MESHGRKVTRSLLFDQLNLNKLEQIGKEKVGVTELLKKPKVAVSFQNLGVNPSVGSTCSQWE